MPSTTTDHGARAVALFVAFWGALTLGLGALLAAPLIEWLVFGRGSVLGAAFTGLGLWLLWALIPSTDDWHPPGPELTPDDQPELFAQIHDVTQELGLPPPEQVFLVPWDNAAIGTHKADGERVRFLLLGLPLLAALPPDELRAVIAHEFGHEHQGDLRMGPWVYSTRRAAFQALERLEGSAPGPQRLIQLCARWFLRASMEISRQQELHADATAARLAGPHAMASALRRTATLGPLWDAFWMGEVVPALHHGLAPPLVEGIRALAAAELHPDEHDDVDPFDTHPPTQDRLAALGALRDLRPPAPAPFVDLEHAERRLFEHLFDGHDAKGITWSEAVEGVYLHGWRDLLATFRKPLLPLTVQALPAAVQDLEAWADALRPPGPSIWSPMARERHALRVLGIWLAVQLLDAGWAMQPFPSVEPRVRKGTTEFKPLAHVRALHSQGDARRNWARRCRELGLAEAGA